MTEQTAKKKRAQIVKGRIMYDACPLCSSEKMETIKKGACGGHPLYNEIISDIITWNKCQDCAHIFTDGYYTDEAFAKIFSKTNPSQQLGADYENQRMVAAQMIEKVLPYAKDGQWMDVGFGNGALLFTAQEYGFTPVGIDLRKENVDKLQMLGIKGWCIDLVKLDKPKQFRVISLADVVEHVPYPKPFMQAVHNVLADDGVILISMPNAGCMLWKFMDEVNVNPYWGELEHFHNFTRERLYEFLRECCFEPVQYGISSRYRACMELIARKK
jgi:2-polyprenyl-3-methyl-5-hydroxy-6-metoxy-1,4-benzoquinol methylase